MAHDGSIRTGEPEAIAAGTPHWLIALKAKAALMRERRERPGGLAFGRWLGDFLDRDTESGLLPAEETLLFAAVNGEACVVQGRAGRLWAAFDLWRTKVPEADLPPEEGFAESMTKFLEGAPETVQEVIHEATIQAIVELGLPADWAPNDTGEAEKLAAAQQAYFARLGAEANPGKTIREARASNAFFLLAAEAATQALALPEKPGARPAMRSETLDLPQETREAIDAQPRVLRDFFVELIRRVKSAPGTDPAYAAKLKADPEALRDHFNAALDRYEREAWRWADPEDPEVRVRASFLRFLALGGDDAAPVPERQLQVAQAYIEEDLDLCGCTISQPLSFVRCHFSRRILLTNATTKTLNFRGSRVQSIDAENAQVRGAVFLHGGFQASGVSFPYAVIEGRLSCQGSTFLPSNGFAINFVGAQIAGNADFSEGFLGQGGVFFHGAKIRGDLDCAAGIFRNRSEDGSAFALGCDNAGITGNAVLASGFRSEGAVSLSGAKIGGALNCTHAALFNPTEDGTGDALNLENAEIENSVHLSDGFCANGRVSFNGAHVEGSFFCAGGRFANPAPAKDDGSSQWRPRVATAISLQGTKIDRRLWLGPHDQDAFARAEILGSVNLQSCHAHEIADRPGSWPAKKIAMPEGRKLRAFVYLDGFTYDRLAAGDHDAGTRKRWLNRQPPLHLGLEFRPQPFEQLVKVYREMGHGREARAIAKFKESRLRRANFIKLWHGTADRPRFAQWLFGPNLFASVLDFLAWPFALAVRTFLHTPASIHHALEWFIVGFGAAYGYGYARLSLFLLALWLAGGALYTTAADQGGFSPSNPAIYLNKELQAKCAKNWAHCPGAPPELPGFSPFTYSLDAMLPVPGLGQKRAWQPIGGPDHPVKIALPTLFWLPENDPNYNKYPDIDMAFRPIGERTLDSIVRAQTLLSWAVLGLLVSMLSGIIKKD